MQKNKSIRFTILIIMSAILITALLANLTLSYLVREKNRHNVFSLGIVELEIEEDEFPQNEEKRTLTPKGTVPKNPHIINTGTTDIYVFLEVTVPYAEVLLVEDEGENINYPVSSGKVNCELFDLLSDADGALTGKNTDNFTNNFTITNNGIFTYQSSWVFMNSSENTENKTHSYLFGYKKMLKTSGNERTTTNLFDKIQLRNILEGELPDNSSEIITINAYGIQNEELRDITIADSMNLSQTELNKMFSYYQNQEG